jgi:uncharacterized membrane protein YebE (DUF533 family)
MGCTAKQTMEGSCTDYRGLSKSEREERIKKDLANKQIREAEAKRLQDEEAKKVRKKYIIYGLIAVAGYFAYKKFKK